MIEAVSMTQGRELPSISFRQIDMPEILDWEVNSEHYIVCKVKVIGKNNNEYINAPEDKNKIEANLKVLNVTALSDKPVDAKTLESKEFQKIKAKVLSGMYNG